METKEISATATTVNTIAEPIAATPLKPRKRRGRKSTKAVIDEVTAAQTVATAATEVERPTAPISAPLTQVCSCCGRILPVSKFRETKKGSGIYYKTCVECVAAKRAASLPDKALSNPRSITYTPQPGKKAILSIADFTDASLFAELKRRGWGGQLTKTETATI